MRILFMGTPDFAAESLKQLYEHNYEICGVFCQPDKPKNRGLKLMPCPVKILAEAHGTPVYQPATLRDGSAMESIRALAPDIIVVVAYGKLLPKEMLDYPKYGCINIHGSVLPKYRGSAPIQWNVLKGDPVAGVSSMYLVEEMDAGDVIDVRKTEVGEDETAGELFDRLMVMGGALLCDTLEKIKSGTAKAVPQDHEKATFAPPLQKKDAPIDWSRTAREIQCHVNGLNPWPVATAELNGNVFKIYKVAGKEDDSNVPAGTILSADKNGITVRCGDGAVVIKELQAPGGKRMAAGDYLRGHTL